MNVLGHWTGEDAYCAWVDRGGGFTDFEWKAMNLFDRARWEKFADAINEQHRGAVSERDALRIMLGRLLDVALVDGYGETVRDEAESLLARAGGR